MTRSLINLFFPKGPYFLGDTQGIQGDALRRHPGMSATVSLQARANHRLQILEIGSYAGFSALTWAQSMEEFSPEGGELLCVDPWTAFIDGADVEKVRSSLGADAPWAFDSSMDDIYDLFLHNISFGRSKKVSIRHFRSPGLEAMGYLRDEYFDIVYVDGRHVYKDVLADLQAASRLVRMGGFLCGDDLEKQLHEVDADAARANIDNHLAQDPKTKGNFHVGVTLAVADFFGGEVTNFGGFFVMRRTATGFEKVDIGRGRTIIPKHWPADWQQGLRDALKASQAAAR